MNGHAYRRRPRRRPPGAGTGSGGGASLLVITTQPSASVANGVALAQNPVIQLRDSNGQNIAQSGVTVSATLVGAGASLSMTAVQTDATGLATFTTGTITGTVGTYQITFSATGFTSVTSNNITLTPGAISPAQCTASVTSAVTVGGTVFIAVQARDQSGNALTVGGASVEVSVTGAQSTNFFCTDLSNGSYSGSFTATVTGTDSVAITANGVAISGSPFTVTVSAALASLLRVGLFNTLDIIGQGPGADTSAPIYRMALGQPSSQANLSQIISLANANDVTLVLNLAGSKSNYVIGGSYSEAAYFAEVDQWISNAALASALTSSAQTPPRAIVYLVDEPFHANTPANMTPQAVNRMGVHCKQNWPGCITAVRASSTFMKNGWKSVSASSWTGVDYGWSQFESNHVPSAGETPTAFFTREKSELLTVNLGMVPGVNIWDGGNYTTLAGISQCWDMQNFGLLCPGNAGCGLIKGTFSGSVPEGSFLTCGNTNVGTTETRFSCSPALLRHIADVIATDAAAPFFGMWSHIYPQFTPQQPWKSYETRSDYVTALDYVVTKCGTRSTFDGWRTPK